MASPTLETHLADAAAGLARSVRRDIREGKAFFEATIKIGVQHGKPVLLETFRGTEKILDLTI